MKFDNRFKDRIALVTGGASGIGLGIAKRIAEEGGTVVLVDLDAEQLQKAKASMPEYDGRVYIQTVDISIEAEVAKAVDSILEQFGQLDIVVNSAGIVGATGTKILDFDVEVFRKVLDVNLVGSFNLIKHGIRTMEPRGYGRILMLASIAGKDDNPGMAGYTSSKAGVIGLVKGIAKEYAHTEITVNALAPAVIATPMNLKTAPEQLEYMKNKIPMNRLGTVEEVAAMVCWIVSEESSFNTGVAFDISGGRAVY
ncbi:MAG: SDR family oxidoreductase [Cyclobacteriaceae bacterium]